MMIENTSREERTVLAALREQIEQVDADLVALLARRVAIARDVGAHKRDAGIAAIDVRREAAVLSRAVALARAAGLPEEAMRHLFWDIIGMCRNVQLEAQ